GKLVNYLTNANKIPVAYKAKVALLYDGKATFNAIFEACKKAEQSIFIQYYIFENGMLADDFMELFTAKRKQGVTIKFIYDGLGSWSLTSSYLKKLKKIDVDVACFLPVRLAALAKTNYRNHRKIVVVDGKIGFTGGINVADKYITGDDNLGPWADIQVQVEGMAVNFLKFIFYNDWYFLSGENLFEENALKRLPIAGNTPVQFVSSGPDSNHATILNEYLYLINNARKYLYIANPYLVPPQALLEALKSSAMSGVDVRIVVPKKSDSMMVKWVVQSHFETLLASGVKIYRYEPGFLHSKIILSDDLVCSVGTANLDIRSFEQNFEVNARIYDAEVTLELKKKFLQYQNNSSQVKLISFSKRSKITRMKENLARLLSPLT
ncbi:MAG TPA: cardiolipin synthase, partial [Flavobacteriaceae bacterium]|nr:cardiolipin synthase [Flavobacteriaceae bacterium]